MTQQSFVLRRKNFWDDFEKMIRGGKKFLKPAAASFPVMYRELTQDLNTARANGFDPSIIDRLNTLALEGNQLLYGNRSFSFGGIAGFLLREFPGTVRSLWRSFGAAALIFYGAGFFMFFICVRFPETAYEIMGATQIQNLEDMYNPENFHYLTPRNVSSDADMFGYYIYNNISIGFQSFAGGVIAGFGSLLVLFLNAVVLGVSAGHIYNTGYGSTFFPFIIAHGAFELTAIILCAQGGLLLGYRFFFTRGLSRSASLREAAKTALPLVSGAAVMLFIAACIEAFWSSRHELPVALRYGAGIFTWTAVILYFLFAGQNKTVRKKTAAKAAKK